jgi:hypothetical protein
MSNQDTTTYRTSPLQAIADELRPVLNRVRAAKKILGDPKPDCAYEVNKMLEPVLFRLSDLIEELEKCKLSDLIEELEK